MDQQRKAKLAVLWVDALVKSERDDIPEVLSQQFDVCQQNRPAPADLAVPAGTAAVFINYDYPDRKALRFAVDLKRLHPSVMMIVLTVQHSEALAVWAFRSRMSDYLVKPVVAADLLRVARLVTDAWRLRTGQDGREVGSLPPALPAEAQDSARPGRHSLLPAIYYVRRHYGEKISLEVAAARCGLKPTQLTRLFHRTYGLTFRDYVVRHRLREARRLLRDPGAKVAEVAEIVGFNDFSYFSRMFKRYFGLQPSEHRGTTPMTSGEGINTESTAQMLHLPPVP